MKTKTATLTGCLEGDALRWVVAMCEGELDESVTLNPLSLFNLCKRGEFDYLSWAHGGPIIEREGMYVSQVRTASTEQDADWHAGMTRPKHVDCYGSTPLIAAMRCYVASRLGDRVEVPEEL